MDFWTNFRDASNMGSGILGLIAIFIVAAVGLTITLPRDRKRVRAATAMFLLAVLGLAVAAELKSFGHEGSFKWIQGISLFFMSMSLVTVLGVFAFDVVLTGLKIKPPAILCDLLLAASYVAATLLLLSANVKDLSGIITTSAVVTAVIGFSLQDTLGNVMGGMALQMERTIAVGDWIRVDNHVGVVKEIRWRQTSIETSDYDTVVIPNSVLMKAQVIVLGRKEGRFQGHRQIIFFHVDYRFSPSDVMGAVTAAIADEQIPYIAATPRPRCGLAEFKESYATYNVKYWLTDMDMDDATDSLVRSRVVYALRRAGITVAIPAVRIFQTAENDERRQMIASQNLERRLAALERVDLFSPLNEQEQRDLAQRLHETPFHRGEVMTRQGAEAACLFIITSGTAVVQLSIEVSHTVKTVATLKDGDFFGEMGLMTGDPRAASVVAETDVSCLRLDKGDFTAILKKRPEIAEAISQILARRRVELEAVREHLTDEAKRSRITSAQGDLLARIRSFFKLEA